MHTVLATSTFEKDAERARLSDDHIIDICVWLARNPRAGVVIPGTGGARKVRFRGRGRGKSGGYRTVHYFGGDDVPLFLLALVDKGERSDLTKTQRNELAAVLPQIADAYRSGVGAKIAKSRRRT